MAEDYAHPDDFTGHHGNIERKKLIRLGGFKPLTNVYDKAHELAKAMKNDETVTAYREAVMKIEKEEAKKKMIEDFRAIQFAAYQDKMSKGEVSEETKIKMQNLVSIIQLNPEITEFLDIEQKFSILFDDIMKILNEAIGIDIIG